LAIASKGRAKLLPDITTFEEQGIKTLQSIHGFADWYLLGVIEAIIPTPATQQTAP
jgi:tripartite-type tricarboxylate transporter receptor subunit TctC